MSEKDSIPVEDVQDVATEKKPAPHQPAGGRWEQMYQRLDEYQQKNGNCLVPNRYEADPQLGAWVSTQRRHHKLLEAGEPSPLTRERVEKLEQIGFKWSAKCPRHVQWEARFQSLVRFKETFGHTAVPINWPEDRMLANWVSTQRQEYANMMKGKITRLDKRRIRLLNSIEFSWQMQRGGRKKRLLKLKGRPPPSRAADRPGAITEFFIMNKKAATIRNSNQSGLIDDEGASLRNVDAAHNKALQLKSATTTTAPHHHLHNKNPSDNTIPSASIPTVAAPVARIPTATTVATVPAARIAAAAATAIPPARIATATTTAAVGAIRSDSMLERILAGTFLGSQPRSLLSHLASRGGQRKQDDLATPAHPLLRSSGGDVPAGIIQRLSQNVPTTRVAPPLSSEAETRRLLSNAAFAPSTTTTTRPMSIPASAGTISPSLLLQYPSVSPPAAIGGSAAAAALASLRLSLPTQRPILASARAGGATEEGAARQASLLMRLNGLRTNGSLLEGLPPP